MKKYLAGIKKFQAISTEAQNSYPDLEKIRQNQNTCHTEKNFDKSRRVYREQAPPTKIR